MLIYPILCHHGVLLNYGHKDSIGRSIAKRLHGEYDFSYKENIYIDKDILETKFKIEEIQNDLKIQLDKNSEELHALQVYLFIKFLYSSLVDSDRLDAENFENNIIKKEIRTEKKCLSELHNKYFNFVDNLRQNKNTSTLNIIRNDILEKCIEKSSNNTGFFSLCVPTGGGKTYSSMAFAINHVIKNNLDRIIYSIPYTSIIEQNSEVFSKILGENNILEHHSNFEKSEDVYEQTKYDLLSENWESQIIVTTNVQFFETFFSNKATRNRKLHNFCNSVIILDEVQAIPIEYLKPCIYMLDELVYNYNCTVIFCSATQIDFVGNNVLPIRENKKPIVTPINEDKNLDNKLKRVEFIYLGNRKLEEISEEIQKNKQTLTIVNTKKCAKDLFNLIKDRKNTFHLSTNMYPIHRKKVILKIKELLNKGEECTVVSTQLIEAGVDIDFPVVFRSIAGIDSIVQAGGRCNREGKLKDQLGKCYVFNPIEKSYLGRGHLRQTSEIGRIIIERNLQDFVKDETIKEYYASLLTIESESIDKKRIIDMIRKGISGGSKQEDSYEFSFQDISDEFKFIDELGYSLIVDCKESQMIMRDNKYSIKDKIRRLSSYSINVPLYEIDNIRELIYKPDVYELTELINLISDSYYDEKTGLNTDKLDLLIL